MKNCPRGLGFVVNRLCSFCSFSFFSSEGNACLHPDITGQLSLFKGDHGFSKSVCPDNGGEVSPKESSIRSPLHRL